MSRDLTTSFANIVSQDVIDIFTAVEIDFVDTDKNPDYLRIWSGVGDLQIGEVTYIGVGQLLSISAVSETQDMEAKGATLGMSGIPAAYLSQAITYPYHGVECRIYLGSLSSPSDKIEVFSGDLSQMSVEEAGDTASITISVENILARLQTPRIVRFTPEDHKTRYPLDQGFDFIYSLGKSSDVWGEKGDTGYEPPRSAETSSSWTNDPNFGP